MLGRTWSAALIIILGAGSGLVGVTPAEAGRDDARTASKAKPRPPKPKVTKVTPASGLTTGGTKVTIKGDHLAGTTRVLFGTTKGTAVKVKNDHKLTVVAPAQVSGAVDIRVKTRGGKSKAGSKARFTYLLAPPTVTSLGTASGPHVGGTRVTVMGRDFEQVSGVTFGGTPGTDMTVVSPTQLAVTTPPHEAGAGGVVVTTAAGSSAGTVQFSFVAVPSAVQATLPPQIPLGPASWSRVSHLACATTPLCMAIGVVQDATGELRPVVHRRTAPGVWVPTELPLPLDAAADGAPEFLGVDCASLSLCAAVGYYSATSGKRAMAIVWNGSSWSAQAITTPTPSDGQTEALSSVSCSSSTTCQGVGYYRDDATSDQVPIASTLSGGTWSAGVAVPTPPATDDAYLLAVDCLSATQCVAVGFRLATGDKQNYAAELAGGSWSIVNVPVPAGANPDPDPELADVSCMVDGPVGQCVAVGTYQAPTGQHGFVSRFTTGGPAWVSSAVPPPGDAAANPDLAMNGVECPTATECFAVGQYDTTTVGAAVLVRVSFGAPTSLRGPLPSSALPTSSSSGEQIACRTATECLTVGDFQTLAGQVPYVEALGPGGWTAAAAPLPADAVTGHLLPVDYLETFGVTAGAYANAGGVERGLLIELPPAP